MFQDRLTTELKLEIAGTTLTVEAHFIELFDLKIRPWGFSAEITFWFICDSAPDEDTIFTPFTKLDAATATFSVKRAYDEVDEEAKPIVLKGLVVAKEVTEFPVEQMADAPVMLRRYFIRFTDRAQALWSQHYPTALYVDSTYQALFSDNLPAGVTLAHDWPPSTVQRPVLSLGLGADENPAHFHDFTFWLLHREHAGLFYDAAANTYKIAATKPSAGPTLSLEPEEVSLLEILFPAAHRNKVAILNGSTLAATKKKEGTNAQAVANVRADFLIRSPIASHLDARSALEAKRAAQRIHGARVQLQIFPSAPPVPNAKLEFGEDFSTKLFVNGKTFRVVHVDILGKTHQPIGDEGGAEATFSNRYELEYAIELEQEAETIFHFPPFARPLWPFHVEGKVVSEQGAADEETYQIYQEAKTSLDVYKVAIPLFADKKVIILYEPVTLSGHFYFPLYKGERVLVALDFDRARFAGHVDWRPRARLPLESQGNHILMGKKATSQTSVSHFYKDAKPELTIKRTQENDTQTLRIYEGTIWMETKENKKA